MHFEQINVDEKDKRKYECEFYSVISHKKSCYFCKHLTDIWLDYSNGPYMFACNCKDGMTDPENFLYGKCELFEEVTEQ